MKWDIARTKLRRKEVLKFSFFAIVSVYTNYFSKIHINYNRIT